MKRSEFEAKRQEAHVHGPGRLNGPRGEYLYSQAVAADVEAAEAAGVVWDPEEEPLPERLIAVPAPAGAFVMVPLPQRHIGPEERFPSMTEATEAVRRYNAWPELWALCQRVRDRTYNLKLYSHTDETVLLEAILRGEK